MSEPNVKFVAMVFHDAAASCDTEPFAGMEIVHANGSLSDATKAAQDYALKNDCEVVIYEARAVYAPPEQKARMSWERQ